jgi:hypothetical protein
MFSEYAHNKNSKHAQKHSGIRASYEAPALLAGDKIDFGTSTLLEVDL